jgi:hypothetical protein
MKVIIYQQSKSAMQSGMQNVKKWLLIPVEENNSRSISSLMNWISSDNTKTQLRFEFKNKEDAIEFAKSQNFEYQIQQPKRKLIKQKSYAQNFQSDF